tara:strand:- start:246 stop:707 length:462 start_codon:yes stop_codon:yes gene_type:complete
MKSEPKTDFLKYWKVIRYFVNAKFNLSTADLDMLLFLYSEEYFTKDKFLEYNEIFHWDVPRFKRLKQDGWIDSLSNPVTGGYEKRKAMYTISRKTKNAISYIYKKLEGASLPTDRTRNPIFKSNRKAVDLNYRKIIIKMNEAIKLQQHPFPEL